jgi:hypothetical protein
MKEALSSSETSVPTRATRRYIPADAILHELDSSQSDSEGILSLYSADEGTVIRWNITFLSVNSTKYRMNIQCQIFHEYLYHYCTCSRNISGQGYLHMILIISFLTMHAVFVSIIVLRL